MELRAGYKQTEVGVIPIEWKVAKIKELASITTGKRNTQDRIEDGEYPFFVRSSVVERIDSYSFDGEAVLTAGDGVGTGKVFHYINGKFDFHQRVYKISDFRPDLDGYFFFLVFSNKFFNRIMSMTAKSSVDSVRLEMIADMQIPLPSIDEQKAIKSALNEVDALIAVLDRLIAKKRDIKQAAMQELLTGKRRLPGFDDDWRLLNIADDSVLKARIGWQGLTTAEYRVNGDYYLVTGTDFINGRIDWNRCSFVDEWRYTQDKNIQLRSGDVLLTKDGTIGKVGYVEILPRPATLNSGIFVIRPKNNSYDTKYFYYVLTSQIFDEFLAKLQAGSTISHLYQKDFVNFSFLAPSAVEEQDAISIVLSDMDTEIVALEIQLDKTCAIKQGMLQELLTGRIRLVQEVEA
jgi:type I restriction enzyme S subunit